METSTELATDEYYDLAKLWSLTDKFDNLEQDETSDVPTSVHTIAHTPVSEGEETQE